MESAHFYLIFVGIFLLSGLKQGLTGFGLGIVAMMLLPLIMPVPEATVAITLVGAISILGSLGVFWKDVAWRETRPLLIGMSVGIPVGIFLLSTISPAIITRFLGVVLLGTAVIQATLAPGQKFCLPQFLGLPIGMISGMLGGAFNMGGPPVLVFLQSRLSTPKVLVATLQMVFAVSMIVRSCLFVSFGFVTLHTVFLVVIGILPAWIGIMVAARFQRFLPQEVLRRIVLLALFLMGLKYLFF